MPTPTPSSPITIVASKNNHYVRPPVQLGEGHMLNVFLSAPGRITRIDPFGCTRLWMDASPRVQEVDRRCLALDGAIPVRTAN